MLLYRLVAPPQSIVGLIYKRDDKPAPKHILCTYGPQYRLPTPNGLCAWSYFLCYLHQTVKKVWNCGYWRY